MDDQPLHCADCSLFFAKADDLHQHLRDAAVHACPDVPYLGEQPADGVFAMVRIGPGELLHAPICPSCGRRAMLRRGDFGVRAFCCDLWSWQLRPLVDRDTHNARRIAHEAFDQIWKSGAVTRTECYALLAAAMNLPEDKCHMAAMTREQADLATAIVRSGALVSGFSLQSVGDARVENLIRITG